MVIKSYVNMNKLFLFFMMFVGTHINCMELCKVKKDGQQCILYLPEDVLENVVRPYLDLQSWARFGQTCKAYAKNVDTGNRNKISFYFPLIETNYYRCTRALGRFAYHEDATIFERLWKFDSREREKDIEKLEGKPVSLLCDKMIAYRKHYANTKEIDKRIAEQLRDAIISKDDYVVGIILESKKYNIFELFNRHTISVAFRYICRLDYKNIDDLLSLLLTEDVDHKNRALQYICKYAGPKILCELLRKGYFQAKESYGNGCTLLHYAGLCGFRQLAALLISKGAHVHAINSWGKQPVHYAYMFEQKYGENGIVSILKDRCEKNHLVISKRGKKGYRCSSAMNTWQFYGTNEGSWLHNFCTYSLRSSVLQ
jgi:hypothetical protein